MELKKLDPRVLGMWECPDFWCGAQALRKDLPQTPMNDRGMVRAQQIEGALRAGTPLLQIPAFQEWYHEDWRSWWMHLIRETVFLQLSAPPRPPQ